jgi:nitrite reductase (NADH) small subunit
MSEEQPWVRVCAHADAPQPGEVRETDASGVAVCLANIGGRLHALDNWCPHRRGPLGQGWVEGNAVVCPWHSWAFDVESGEAQPPDYGHVDVFPVKEEEDAVWVRLG